MIDDTILALASGSALKYLLGSPAERLDRIARVAQFTTSVSEMGVFVPPGWWVERKHGSLLLNMAAAADAILEADSGISAHHAWQAWQWVVDSEQWALLRSDPATRGVPIESVLEELGKLVAAEEEASDGSLGSAKEV